MYLGFQYTAEEHREAEQDCRISVTSKHGQAVHCHWLLFANPSLESPSMSEYADRPLPFWDKPHVRLYRDTGQIRGQPIPHGLKV